MTEPVFEEAWHAFTSHLHHHTSAAPAAAAVTIRPTQGAPVSLFTEAKSISHDLLEKLENIDENAVAAAEAIKINPTGVSIVNTVASIAHLPDPMGLLATIDATLKAVGAVLAQAAQATAPAPGTGPQVAGQA